MGSMQKFVSTESWGMLRLGYNPLETVLPGSCPANCACTPATETNRVCSVSLPANMTTPHCDIRSFVAYAVHKTLYPELDAYAHASYSNLTMYLGLLSETRKDFKGSKTTKGFVSTPQDIYMPSTIGTIHYMTPGFMTQHDKPEQAFPMANFGKDCNPSSPSSAVASTKSAKRGQSSSVLFSDRFRQALLPK